MNETAICKTLRHEFDKPAIAVLVYCGIMNVTVSLVAALDILAGLFSYILSGNRIQPEMLAEQLTDQLLNNGWGYILAVVIGAVMLVIWKKKNFCFGEIWKQDKLMSAGTFFMLLCVFISGQALFQMLAGVMEALFGIFGISFMDTIESVTVTANSNSMFLYIALFAPVFEEILFRGLVLRSLLPYGKKFAILASAFLFGIFHGNLAQSPYAFAVGLVLGYVAAEYCLFWSVILHIINNFVLGEVMTLVMGLLQSWAGDLIYGLLTWGCALGTVVIFAVKRNEIAGYFRSGKIHPLCLKSFYTAPAVLVLTGMMVFNMLLTVLL